MQKIALAGFLIVIASTISASYILKKNDYKQLDTGLLVSESEKTLMLIEIPNDYLEIHTQSDTNYILQNKMQPIDLFGKKIQLTYVDTISLFNSNDYSEKIQISFQELPVKILEIK